MFSADTHKPPYSAVVFLVRDHICFLRRSGEWNRSPPVEQTGTWTNNCLMHGTCVSGSTDQGSQDKCRGNTVWGLVDYAQWVHAWTAVDWCDVVTGPGVTDRSTNATVLVTKHGVLAVAV